jgi:outer membrane protein
MRVLAFLSALALTVALPLRAEAQGGQKFAFVNSQALLQAAPGAADAQAQFQKEVESLRTQIQAMTDSMSAMEKAYTDDAEKMTDSARIDRLKAITDKRGGFEQRAEALNEQAEQRQAELMQPIMDNVRKALDDFRGEGGYAFIFDIANAPFIVAADRNLDVTERVIAKLRTMGAPKAATPARPPTTPAAGPAARPAGVQARPTTRPPTE